MSGGFFSRLLDGGKDLHLSRLKCHADATFGPQGHHQVRLNALLGKVQLVVTTDQGQQEWSFNRRKM